MDQAVPIYRCLTRIADALGVPLSDLMDGCGAAVEEADGEADRLRTIATLRQALQVQHGSSETIERLIAVLEAAR